MSLFLVFWQLSDVCWWDLQFQVYPGVQHLHQFLTTPPTKIMVLAAANSELSQAAASITELWNLVQVSWNRWNSPEIMWQKETRGTLCGVSLYAHPSQDTPSPSHPICCWPPITRGGEDNCLAATFGAEVTPSWGSWGHKPLSARKFRSFLNQFHSDRFLHGLFLPLLQVSAPVFWCLCVLHFSYASMTFTFLCPNLSVLHQHNAGSVPAADFLHQCIPLEGSSSRFYSCFRGVLRQRDAVAVGQVHVPLLVGVLYQHNTESVAGFLHQL